MGEHPKGMSCSMEAHLVRNRLVPSPYNSTLLFITSKQDLSQEQRVFPLAYGQPQVLCLGVLGGQLQLPEQQLAQGAVSIFTCKQRKTNHDFQQHRSNSILVTANNPARMSKGGVFFQDPFPLICSVHWDFTPSFVIWCTTFSLS